MSQNGKGDKRRPQKVSNKEFDDNWDRIFRKGADDIKERIDKEVLESVKKAAKDNE